jgi:hypothetical protein
MLKDISKNLIWAIVAIVSIILVFGIKRKKAEVINYSEEANKIAPNYPVLQRLAQELAHHLGTAYSWYNPRSWAENDEEIFKLLVAVSKNDFKVVEKLYNSVYAKGNDLRRDLAKLLDSKYYEQLSNL